MSLLLKQRQKRSPMSRKNRKTNKMIKTTIKRRTIWMEKELKEKKI